MALQEFEAWLVDFFEKSTALISTSSLDIYAVLDDHDCFALGPSVRAHWVAVPETGVFAAGMLLPRKNY